MTPFSQKILRTSGALIAISMLSACANSPTIGHIGDSVSDTWDSVSSTTMEYGGRAVAGTKDFLGLYATEDGKAPASDNQLIDGDVDLALINEDQSLLDGETGIVIETVDTPSATKQPLENAELLADADAELILDADTELALANPDPLAPADALVVEATTTESVATSDLIHEVQQQENLWDIAKKTTGDANNWHVLADINNLAPNASVFPGQELTIPADMVKPGYLDGDSSQGKAVSTASNDSERLLIPENNNDEINPVSDTSIAAVSANAEPFEIEPSETLWNFAKRTTGDATNWQAIAKQNNFSEQQAVSVRPGQTIFVPADLIKNDSDTVAKTAPKIEAPEAATADTTVAAKAPVDKADSEAISATANALATAGSILDETQPIKIVEAKFQTEDGAAEINSKTLAAEASQQLDDTAGEQIMVSGTYYPKAIYNDADFSSSLLMRVSPGTQLTVSKAVGPWYEVMTDKGIGYVHTRDIK